MAEQSLCHPFFEIDEVFTLYYQSAEAEVREGYPSVCRL